MDASDYADLYALQDEVLAVVFDEPTGFYLTGGTALSRYYLGHRYSDDLDLFTHDVGVFGDAFRLVHGKIQKQWSELELEVDARDFKRLRILSDGMTLKLDFVADRVGRVGLPDRVGTIYVDTVRNILGNKLCAIMGRDEARDVADLLFIARKRHFSWSSVLTEVADKETFQLEDLLYRLSTFPVALLSTVPFIQQEAIALHLAILDTLREDLAGLGENTVAEPGSCNL
jgi:predicted nucleotidyltransferase component of viral defense system